MERVNLPLRELTLSQKLDLMEALWEDLSREGEALESPSWHETVLKDREAALAEEQVGVPDWEESKERIRQRIR